MDNATAVCHAFAEQYGAAPDLVVRAPGRVNLIGEHVDYNQGLVLPAAITFYTTLALRLRADDKIHLWSIDYGQAYQTTQKAIAPSGLHWPDYLLGVADQMQRDGKVLRGFEVAFGGDVPVGAGLSSSASVECATALALNEALGLGYDRMALARLCQRAENEFVGVNCGLMDQFASMFGQAQKLMLLDCRSLAYRYIPFETDDIRIVLLDTRVKHSLGSSEYNTRRAQCEEGVRLVQARHPEVRSLREATEAQLEACVAPADALVYRRCRFVVAEIARVEAACQALEQGDFASFGRYMYQSHQGLSTDYEVSCQELDFLVEAVRNRPGVYGARMMGGGFGGCTINLVQAEAVDDLIYQVGLSYQARFGQPMGAYVAEIGEGANLIKN